MAIRKTKQDEVYAVASATNAHGYGHLTIHVYNALGHGGATLKLDCQAGGTSPGETYSWKHGVWKDYSVLDMETMRRGYLLMRSIRRVLDKLYDEHGSVKNFAEYALRVLRAAGVKQVYLRPGLNSTFYGDATTLKGYRPKADGDALLTELKAMETIVIKSC